MFVVTGRKEDVALAKREILSAADHFSQIRASRKSNINSTLAFGQLMANTPGQTTVQVRVPYRVVGLVVGPKGATIKRIQQQTHTYIVTPSRDKEPVFEVTGLPENVEAARKEIEAHIAIRTGAGASDFNGMGSNDTPSSRSGGLYFNLNDGPGSSQGPSGVQQDDNLFSASGGLNSPFSSSSGNLDHVNSILNSDTNGFASFKNGGITLANLLDQGATSQSGPGGASDNFGRSNVAWSNGTDSHDSGIGHSPPFDNGVGSNSNSAFMNFKSNQTQGNDPTLNGIWGELNKVLGGLDLNGGPGDTSSSNSSSIEKPCFLSIGSRSSLDLGTLGRPLTSEGSNNQLVAPQVTSSASLMTNNHTANNMGRQLSLPSGTTTPPSTLPGFNGILSSSEFNKNPAETKETDALPSDSLAPVSVASIE